MAKNIENRVHFTHIRNVGKAGKKNFTIAFQFRGEDVHVGVAQCSKRDQYNKKMGRTIAQGRLNRALEGDETDHSFTMYETAHLPKRDVIGTVAHMLGIGKDWQRISAERQRLFGEPETFEGSVH